MNIWDFFFNFKVEKTFHSQEWQLKKSVCWINSFFLIQNSLQFENYIKTDNQQIHQCINKRIYWNKFPFQHIQINKQTNKSDVWSYTHGLVKMGNEESKVFDMQEVIRTIKVEVL